MDNVRKLLMVMKKAAAAASGKRPLITFLEAHILMVKEETEQLVMVRREKEMMHSTATEHIVTNNLFIEKLSMLRILRFATLRFSDTCL